MEGGLKIETFGSKRLTPDKVCGISKTDLSTLVASANRRGAISKEVALAFSGRRA